MIFLRKILLIVVVLYAFYFFSQNDILHSLEQAKETIQSDNAKIIQNDVQKMIIPTQQSILQQEKNNNTNTHEQSTERSSSIPTVSKSKYPIKDIQTYQVRILNGKLVITGKATSYGQYTKADGVILYIEEPRSNKKLTVKVPFNNWSIYYKYPLTYTVGDIIINLDEYKNGIANDPNKVLGYAEFHLTDGDPYLLSSFMVQSNNHVLVTLAREITKGKHTTTAKSRAIFEWVAKNIAYNAPLVNDPNPPLYSALQTYESSVVLCSGYADLNAALHRAVGIEAKVVYGDNHAWNEINLNGVWQTEDPTYGSGFINANTNTFVRSYHPAYFYKSDSHEQGIYPF